MPLWHQCHPPGVLRKFSSPTLFEDSRLGFSRSKKLTPAIGPALLLFLVPRILKLLNFIKHTYHTRSCMICVFRKMLVFLSGCRELISSHSNSRADFDLYHGK